MGRKSKGNSAASDNRVFLSYAHEDLEMVRKIYIGLKKRKVNVWFDKVDLGPGKWLKKIMKAIPRSRYFVICLSEAALKKTGDDSPGFQDEELQQAWQIASDQPESSFTIVPVRLEDCGRGDIRTTTFQQYDLFDDFETGLDNIAVNFGGISLGGGLAEDTRTEDAKIFESLMGRADALYYAGEFQKAFNALEYITNENPNNDKAWYKKGVTLSKIGRKEESLKAYDKALEINSEDPYTWSSKGAALRHLDRCEEAIKTYDKALEIKSDYANAWENKGVALEVLGQDDEAKYCFEMYERLTENDKQSGKFQNTIPNR